ncbi:methyltransferase domain-containing protein [Thiohalorhabdus sp. Cl-TMA]|uniref:Malonyl-[acyl-carrier protein] O-methyltransferase n=1 Tax=Thiohalorhabdus methylotrophus TaxID=3242694 RepID=A0ABV4TSB9_9GAMM
MPHSPETCPPEEVFDKRAVRRDFARAAATYDRHAALQRRVAAEVAELYRGLAPTHAACVLDLGCGTGYVGRDLMAGTAAPEAVVALDLAHPMTRRGRVPGHPAVTGDADRLPFVPGAFDAVVSSLTLQWANDLRAALRGIVATLRPGGLLIASTLLAGTLRELDTALRRTGGAGRAGPFLETSDAEAALASAGLAGYECRTVLEEDEAPGPMAVLRDLKGLGAVAKGPDRARGLRGRRHLDSLCRAYRETTERPAGPVPVTWHVGYLVGWKPF